MKPHFFALCAFALFFAAPPARADKPRSDITTHLTWRASVSIDADDDLLRWNVKAESAKLSLVTAPEGKRPGYRFESESVLESGGRYLDANIALKIMWKGRVYELLTGAHFALQKTAAFQLGTTPDGLAVWLHLTPEVAWLAPEAPAKPAPMPSPGAHHGTAVFIAPLGATPAVPDIGAIMAFPACPNPIADVLPGKMYDVRQYLSSAGIKLSDDDFAWFHLKGDLLIVRASRKNLALVGRMVDTWQSALPRNALIDAGANIGDGRAAWQIRTKDEAFTKDDWTAVSSASGGPGIGHRCRITGKLSDDNRSFRYKATIEVTYQGRAYKLERAGAVPAGKTQSFLLGATHGGIPVRFHFAASAETVPPASALDDPALKARLLRHLGATLYKQPKTTGPNPAPLELKK